MAFSSVRCVKKNFITETSWTHFTCKWFISLWWIDLSFPGFKRMIQWVMSEMSDHSSLISLMSDDEWRMIVNEWRMSGEWNEWWLKLWVENEWNEWNEWRMSEMSELSEMSDEWWVKHILFTHDFTHHSFVHFTHELPMSDRAWKSPVTLY